MVAGRSPPSRWSCRSTFGATRTPAGLGLLTAGNLPLACWGRTGVHFRSVRDEEIAMTTGERAALTEDTRIIRPAAVLGTRAAAEVVRHLQRLDVARGGTWNASSSLWQRYDRPWDGPGGTRGGAQLVGSIAVVYDSPTRHSITVYKVTVSSHGLGVG